MFTLCLSLKAPVHFFYYNAQALFCSSLRGKKKFEIPKRYNVSEHPEANQLNPCLFVQRSHNIFPFKAALRKKAYCNN